MKEIVIPISRKRIAFLILGSVSLVSMCFWLIQLIETQTLRDLFFVIISSAGVIIFSACTIYFLIKFFDKKPGLVINDEGITDSSSAVSAGLITWENITNVGVFEIYGQKILTIEVSNSDEILSKQSGFKKLMMKLNMKFFHSPIQISSNALKCSFQELLNVVKEQQVAHHLPT